VVDAMAEAARSTWANPSSAHREGRAARSCVEQARQSVAVLAECDPRDVVFTSGGTEANNLAIRSAFASRRGRLVTSRLEHPSVTRVAEALERQGSASVHWLQITERGIIDIEDLERTLLEGGAALVAVQAVNGETGVEQPIDAVIALAKRAGVPVHVDAVQAFGRLAEVAREADTRSLAGHKMRGPKSVGALVSRPGVPISPVLLGGAQERGLRPGTVDPVAAAGLAAAARRATSSPARWQAVGPLRDMLETGLCALAPGARIHGAGAKRAPHVTNVAFPGWAGPELVAALDLEGLAVSSGSACSAGTAEASAALTAMSDARTARSSVRFSIGEDTTESDIEFALAAATRVLHRA
jgi:cysteine desulfurase